MSLQSWPEIEAITPGHGDRRPEPSNALFGQSVTLNSAGASCKLRFGNAGGGVFEPDHGPLVAGSTTVFEVRPDRFFIDVTPDNQEQGSICAFLDRIAGRGIALRMEFPDPVAAATPLQARFAAHGRLSAVGRTVWNGPVDAGSAGGAGEGFLQSTALVGLWQRHVYSDTHVYDHMHLNAGRYCWYCHAGPDQGLGDCEESQCFALGEDLFLFCWQEKLMPCAGIMVEDHAAGRSVGRIAGRNSVTGAHAGELVGADIYRLAQIAPYVVAP